MSLRIGTNVASEMGRNRLERHQKALGDRFAHLSSGKRIAKAADDASGAAISSRLLGRLRSLDRAARNADDGLSLARTAEGGLGEIQSALTRMRELSVQAANGTLGASDRAAIHVEFDQLRAEIDQIAQGTTFNKIDLLSTGATITLTVGEDVRAGVDTIDLTLPQLDAATLGLGASSLALGGDPSAAIAALDGAIDVVATAATRLGAAMERITSARDTTRIRNETQTDAHSRIVDADIAAETALLTRDTILRDSAVSMVSQANAQPTLAAQLLFG